MTWIFSRAMMEHCESSRYSQEREEGFLEESCSDGEQLPQLSVMPTPHKFWRNDKTMDVLSLSRFGLTCAVLTERRGAELLTSYLAGFHVKTSAQQERGRGSTAQDQACGRIWPALLAKLDPASGTWKTVQLSLLEDSGEFSGTWPRSGTMRNGCAYQRASLAHHMSAKESGFWLPTPTAHNAKECNAPSESLRNTPTLGSVLGGKINPQFTEWMMGWPVGQTDLKPLGMDKFQSWLRQHSLSS